MSYQELQQAADQALASEDTRTAATLYVAALDRLQAAPDADAEFVLRAGLALCQHRLADYAAEQVELAALAGLADQLADPARRLVVAVRQVELDIQLGHASEGRSAAEAALSAARALNNQPLEADCLYVCGRACAVLGDYGQAQRCHEQALELYRLLGNRKGEAHSLRELGWGAARAGNRELGQGYLEQALELYRLLGNREGEGMALNELSIVSGDYARQRACLEQALVIFESLGDRHKLCILANNLGLVYLLLGLYGQARGYCERAVGLARDLHARSSLVFCLDTFAHACLGLGEIELAARTYSECYALAVATGQALEAAYARLGLGRVALSDGRALEARTLLAEAVAGLAALDAGGERAAALAWLANACLALDDQPAAEQYSAEAVGLLAAGLVSQDFPPQDIWWQRYQVLRARGNADTGGDAAYCLERAHSLLLEGIATLSDAGLLRNYLNKVPTNRRIVEEWTRLSTRDGPASNSELPALLPLVVRDQLARMLAISVQMNERREDNALRRFILGQIVELSGAERALLILYEDAEQPTVETFGVVGGELERVQALAAPLIETVGRTRRAELRHGLVAAGGSATVPSGLNRRSALCLPLVAAGRLSGVLYGDNRELFGPFSAADVDLLTVLATQAATALENVRLYNETLRANRELEQRVAERTLSLERRVSELATVNQIGQAVAQQLELSALIELVGETMREVFDAQNVYVALYERERERITFPYDLEEGQRVTGEVLRFGVGLTSEILLTRKPLLLNGEVELRHAGLRIAIQGAAARSFLGVPILVGEEAIGVISVQSTQRDGAFSEADVRLLTTIASSVGIAIANARLYAERKRMQQAAEAASVAKSTFLANMSHELRTPLNAVLGFAQVLARDSELSLRQRDHLAIISRSGEHLLQLINDVLEMSKIEAGRIVLNPAPFELPRLLQSVVELFVLRAEAKELWLRSSIDTDLPQFVIGDESKLRQVLINLLGNAVKFTYEGGVTLRVRVVHAAAESTAVELAPRIHFEVEDTGEGIAPEQLETLFQPFVQTSSGVRSQEGTGLGLTISRQFVQLMGGDITVESLVGQGSRFGFSVELPLATDQVPRESSPELRVLGIEPTDGREYRILVVDDKWENRRLICEWLSGVGLAVREAADGQEALDIWQEWEPQLIWMDLRMPVLDGYEATRRIKASLKGQATAVIALTASTFEHEHAVMLATGCDDFVRKPVREATIFAKLAQHLGVRFIYEAAPAEAETVPIVLTRAALRVLPQDLREQLRRAVEEVDAEAAQSLVAQLAEQHGELARGLAELVEGYRFDRLLELLEDGAEEGEQP